MEGIAKMDHNEAIRSMIVEKYLLSDLTPELREEFEEHFFDCRECGDDVRTGAAFLEHSKTILSSVPVAQSARIASPSPSRPAWTAWLRGLAVPAMAVLLAVVGYQNFATVPKLKSAIAEANAPRIFPSASLIAANSRGARQPRVTVSRGESFLLFLDVNTASDSPSYVADLYDPAGNLEWSLAIPSAAAKETLSIRVPPSERSAGTYTLVVSGVGVGGSKNSEIGRYPFELQWQNSEHPQFN
jgi:Putative zinc-finger